MNKNKQITLPTLRKYVIIKELLSEIYIYFDKCIYSTFILIIIIFCKKNIDKGKYCSNLKQIPKLKKIFIC